MSKARKAAIAVLLLLFVFFSYKFISVQLKIRQEKETFYNLLQVAQSALEESTPVDNVTEATEPAEMMPDAPLENRTLEVIPEYQEYKGSTPAVKATNATEPEGTIPDTPSEDTTPAVISEYQKLFEINPEFAGWVRLPGCGIDYPVMHTPYDPEKYLHRDFYGAESFAGVPFLDASCTDEGGIYILYGHNMANGTMFGQLRSYWSKDYWEKNQDVQFDTLYTQNEYRIFASARIYLGVNDNQFEYYKYTDLRDEKIFEEFIKRAKGEALYDTGLTPAFGDEILVLSTCGSSDNERMVVFAYREK